MLRTHSDKDNKPLPGDDATISIRKILDATKRQLRPYQAHYVDNGNAEGIGKEEMRELTNIMRKKLSGIDFNSCIKCMQ